MTSCSTQILTSGVLQYREGAANLHELIVPQHIIQPPTASADKCCNYRDTSSPVSHIV